MDLIKGPLMFLKGPLRASSCPRSQPGSPQIKTFLPPLFSATQWELVGGRVVGEFGPALAGCLAASSLIPLQMGGFLQGG